MTVMNYVVSRSMLYLHDIPLFDMAFLNKIPPALSSAVPLLELNVEQGLVLAVAAHAVRCEEDAVELRRHPAWAHLMTYFNSPVSSTKERLNILDVHALHGESGCF